jgi:hypothetical protein
VRDERVVDLVGFALVDGVEDAGGLLQHDLGVRRVLDLDEFGAAADQEVERLPADGRDPLVDVFPGHRDRQADAGPGEVAWCFERVRR